MDLKSKWLYPIASKFLVYSSLKSLLSSIWLPEEWLMDNYFHTILEVTKSVPDKIRQISGLKTDGAPLIYEAFGLGNDNKPMLAFNLLQSESDISEHKGFNNFLKGFNGMYRNPKAHNPKIHEDTQLDDLTEVLLIASVIYRKLDFTYRTGYK